MYGGQGDQWRIEEIQSCREVVARGSLSHIVRDLPDSWVPEYITVHYTATSKVRVKTFTLLLVQHKSWYTTTTTTTPLTIAGWVCAASSSSSSIVQYKIPIQRQMTFLRVDTTRLEVVFDRPVSSDVVIHVGVMSSNFVRQQTGMIGVAWAH